MGIYRRKTARIVLNGFLAGALSALVCFAQKPAASHSAVDTSSQKVVLKVGDAQITKADIEYLISSLSPRVQKAVATRGKRPVGDEYAMMVLLSQKAKSDHLDTTPDFQRRMALEKLQLLAQAEYQRIAQNITVSQEEISTYYNAHKAEFEEAQLREFVVRKKPENAKPDSPGLPVVEAKARLAAIQKAIEAGSDLKQVAKRFDVPNTVIVNPQPVTVHRGEMLPALDKAAFELEDNQFSQPVDTPQALVLLQMLKLQKPDLQAVSGEIQNTLRQQKLKTTLDEMKAKANIWMDPDYFNAAGSSSGE